jgi:integrase
MRRTNQLTSLKIARLNTAGRYGDGLGLWLQVGPTGGKAWLFRYQRAGKARQMGLGALHTISLAEARDKARECRKLLLAGMDPIEAKRDHRTRTALAKAQGTTFRECAERYIGAHQASWRNPKHAAQWPATLASYVFPHIGALPVAAIDTDLVLKCIEPIWAAKPETAGRIRGRIELILDWAKAREMRLGENPARWRGHLDKLLPAKSKIAPTKHHAALSYREMAKFMALLRKRSGISVIALQFTILTAARTSEAIGAEQGEVDSKNRIWIVPAVRMKARREHRVPLADTTLKLLKSLPTEKGNPHLFIGARSGAAVSNMAMLEVLREMDRGDLTVHGFRSTFRDWAAETTNYPNEVVEMALAHAVGDKVEAAYRRGDLFEKRRALANDWARYCDGKSTSAHSK